MHNVCNINKLEDRRDTHLLNVAFSRSKDPTYTSMIKHKLRRFDAPVLNEVKSNNKSFERSVQLREQKLGMPWAIK